MKIKSYNLRVYGILIQEDSVLVTEERRAGMEMLKFPGGGLEKGEGLSDCLIREFSEELDITVSVKSIFYVNEFFQQSAFSEEDQLISFYYQVSTPDMSRIPVKVGLDEGDEQIFRWVRLSELYKEAFTFPIDKVVAKRLAQSSHDIGVNSAV